jgi:predicted acylesterase/phospholipase RssA
LSARPPRVPDAVGQVDFTDPDIYRAAPRECDLVLEGGIAGGVVYPRAVLEIARTHRLRSLGGASAGAIAVALAAAAEYARAQDRHGPGLGFAGLAAVDGDLRRPGVLRGLFAPRPESAPLVDFVARLFSEKAARDADAPEVNGRDRFGAEDGLAGRWLKKWRRARPWLRSLDHFDRGRALGGLVGGGVGLLAAAPLAVSAAGAGHLPALLASAVAGTAAFAVGAFLGGVLGAVDEALTLVETNLRPERSFGLCPGIDPPATGAPPGPRALFDWLHGHVQSIAGRGAGDPPLTFEDLERVPGHREIVARMVTTNLNAQRAHRVPFEDGEVFVYRRSDLAGILPAALTAALEAESKVRPACAGTCELPPGDEFAWFPTGARLPLVVGVRLSMSFPLVFAAVRLYMVTSEATRRGGPLSADRDLVECWFSDGGICNNFPLQFFDVWFPERPTFGINLADAPLAGSALRDRSGAEPGASDVERREIGDERRDDWPAHELRGPGDFLSALAETLLAHRDNALTRLAGYRERVATVRLGAGEGALNLDMAPDTIDALGERGRAAARALPAVELDRHQWVRLRALLGALETEVQRMEHYGLSRETVVAAPVAGLDGLRGDWERLLNVARAAESSATPYYPPAADRASPPEAVDAAYAELTRRAESLLGLMRALSTAAADGSAAPVSDDAPRPRGELRITSKV